MCIIGHASGYQPDYARLAHNCCRLGASHDRLPEFFGFPPPLSTDGLPSCPSSRSRCGGDAAVPTPRSPATFIGWRPVTTMRSSASCAAVVGLGPCATPNTIRPITRLAVAGGRRAVRSTGAGDVNRRLRCWTSGPRSRLSGGWPRWRPCAPILVLQSSIRRRQPRVQEVPKPRKTLQNARQNARLIFMPKPAETCPNSSLRAAHV